MVSSNSGWQHSESSACNGIDGSGYANSIEFHRRVAMVIVSIAVPIDATNTTGSTTGIQAGPNSNDRAVSPPCANNAAVMTRIDTHARRYDVNQAIADTVVTMFAKM